MKYIIYHLWVISLLFPLGMQAKVRLTSIWGDNMVLQQQSEVTFHGKASANSKITIEASWNHRKQQPEVTSMEIGTFNSYSGSRGSLYYYIL